MVQRDARSAAELKHSIVGIDVKQINRPAASLAVGTARGHNPTNDMTEWA